MTESSNPFFARAIANRIWAHYFGRGLVEPVDDMRASNPATNEPLLDALAQHLRETGYDLKAFTRTLLASRVYQLSGETNETNLADKQYFSHAESRTLPAEVLLDAISQVTASPEKFNGWPLGAARSMCGTIGCPPISFASLVVPRERRCALANAVIRPVSHKRCI